VFQQYDNWSETEINERRNQLLNFTFKDIWE
jgi:hypothetical protein